MQETTGVEATTIIEELKLRSAEFLREFVELGLAVHMTNAMTLALEPDLKSRYGYTHLAQLHDPEAPLPFTEEELEQDVGDLVSVMRSGLRA